MSQLPYQRLEKLGTTLVAARGSRIDTFNLQNGSYLSSWKSHASLKEEAQADPDEETNQKLTREKSDSVEIVTESGPAVKRRKLSKEDSVEAESPQKEETESNNGTAKKKAPRTLQGSHLPNVILLASTADWQHVVAVTGEDKTIRVFKMSEAGVLEQLSQRAMPKRPCALSITADSSTIICGDKSGDVYALPLIPTPMKPEPETKQNGLPETASKDETQFVPAANHFTVHSQRNRKALENQKKQGKKAAEKTEPTFEHSLLLGHVSMLTDLALVCVEGRNYIITADKDEHIRISRGIPQSHIIESYCFGHTEFVSKICAPGSPNAPNLLISGGGGDELFAWDVPTGNMLQKVDLKTHVEKVTSEVAPREETEGSAKIAVSGIYRVWAANEIEGQAFAVTCEGVPAIFFYFWNIELKTLSYTQTLKLDGNPLDLVSLNWNCSIIVSVDTYIKSGSINELRSSTEPDVRALQYFMVTADNVWYKRDNQYLDTESAPKMSSDEEQKEEAVVNLLYNLHHLRKQEKEEKEEEE